MIAHFVALALALDDDHELPSDVEVEPNIACSNFCASNLQQQNNDDLVDDF